MTGNNTATGGFCSVHGPFQYQSCPRCFEVLAGNPTGNPAQLPICADCAIAHTHGHPEKSRRAGENVSSGRVLSDDELERAAIACFSAAEDCAPGYFISELDGQKDRYRKAVRAVASALGFDIEERTNG